VKYSRGVCVCVCVCEGGVVEEVEEGGGGGGGWWRVEVALLKLKLLPSS